MIDLTPLKAARTEAQKAWRDGLPTEEVRQALLAADAAVKAAIEENEVEQSRIDEQYMTAAARCFVKPPTELLQKAYDIYTEIVELVRAAHEFQILADKEFDNCSRLQPSEKAQTAARAAKHDAYGCRLVGGHPTNIYEAISNALVGHVYEGKGLPFVKTAFLTPCPKYVGNSTNEDAVEHERKQLALNARQLGPR